MRGSQVVFHKPETIVLVALGANLPSVAGSPQDTLLASLRDLDGDGLSLKGVSNCYKTPCFPAGAGPDYINAAASLTTSLDADAILTRLHKIESSYGRTRDERWGARGLDLDLLAYGDSILPDRASYMHWHDLSPELQAKAAPDRLVLPHPRIQDRGFVLVPLNDVAPDWVHPVHNLSVATLLDNLGEDGRKDIEQIAWPAG